MIQDNNHIIADEGKVFRRKVSGEIFGKEIYLGYSYYIGGVLQNPPHLDTPEDFEEIDEPDEDEMMKEESVEEPIDIEEDFEEINN